MKFSVFLSAFLIICMIVGFALFSQKPVENKVIIKFSSWGSKSEVDILKHFISKFESDNPNIKVDFLHIPQNYFQKIQLLFASGLEPDVVFINNQNIQMYINAGLLEDLTEYFGDYSKEFYNEALDCFRENDKLYAIARDISNLVIYYNKDIFKKQNVKMPKEIKDIFELRKLAKKISAKDNLGINYEDNILFWGYYLASNGGGIISEDKKNIIINAPKSIEALNLYADMINKDKSMPSKAQMGSMTSAQMFINGKIAMYLSGRWMTPKFRETITFDWDVTAFPSLNKVYIDASGYAISKKSKHKKEAAMLIRYLLSQEALEKTANLGLIIPAKKDVPLQDDYQKPLNYSVFYNMLENAKPTVVNENYAAITNTLNEKVENIFNGKKRAEDVFDEKTIKQLKDLL